MNESKENLRLNGKKVLIWGTLLSLILVGLVFLYVPEKPKSTAVPKNFVSFEAAGRDTPGLDPSGQAEAEQTTKALHTPEDTYQNFCSQCHGKTGNGDSPMARMMTVKPSNLIEGPFRFERNPEAIAVIVRQGIGTTMPGFKDEISEEQALQLARYVLGLAAKP